MKLKIYFIVSAITQIIASVISIFNADKIIKTMLDSLNTLPDAMMDRTEAIFLNSGSTYIIGISSICIILNIIILIISIKNNYILKRKGILLTCSVISFMCATNKILELTTITNILVLIINKRTKKEEFPEKREIPLLDRKTNTKKEIILTIILLLTYFSQLVWSIFIPDNITLTSLLIINIIFDIIMLTLTIIIFYKDLKEAFTLFKNNFSAYISYTIPKLGIMYLIYFAVALISMLITNTDTSVNQKTLESLPLLYLLPAAIICAPIIEEILFRGCLRRLIKNDKLFIITSGLIFGLLHTINEPTFFNMIIVSLPYATLGGFLAYIYTKTNNIMINIGCHALHNTIAMLISILLMI